MASFLLGDKVAPKIESNASKIINPTAASISDYTPANFSVAGIGKKQAELNSKLASSGQYDNFNSPYVGGDALVIRPRTQVSASSMPSSSSEDRTIEMKVTISQSPEVGDGPNQIIFKVMPRIDEAGGAEYEPVTPVQHPGSIQKFRNSSARTWNVSGKLISRTSEEASENVKLLNMIRSWRLPFFGTGTGSNAQTAEFLGAPPPILTLSAYGKHMIGPVKCVLTNYNWAFENNVDYIPTLEGNSFPVMLDVSLSLVESWSPSEFSGFDIIKYKNGDMGSAGAFQKTTMSAPLTQIAGNMAADEPTVVSSNSFDEGDW